jgi:peptidoglycan/LPS O-acetylase OafA/YrhL
MGNVNKSYAGIDILKFVMAIAVIAIHCNAVLSVSKGNTNYGYIYPTCMNWFIQLAVPFFFIVSGFLLGQKLNDVSNFNLKKKYLKDRTIHLFKLYGYWLLIYLPISIYSCVTSDVVWWKFIAIEFYRILFCGMSYFSWPLWFIYSMAIILFIYSRVLFSSKWILEVLMCIFLIISFVNWIGVIQDYGLGIVYKRLSERALGGAISYSRYDDL